MAKEDQPPGKAAEAGPACAEQVLGERAVDPKSDSGAAAASGELPGSQALAPDQAPEVLAEIAARLATTIAPAPDKPDSERSDPDQGGADEVLAVQARPAVLPAGTAEASTLVPPAVPVAGAPPALAVSVDMTAAAPAAAAPVQQMSAPTLPSVTAGSPQVQPTTVDQPQPAPAAQAGGDGMVVTASSDDRPSVRPIEISANDIATASVAGLLPEKPGRSQVSKPELGQPPVEAPKQKPELVSAAQQARDIDAPIRPETSDVPPPVASRKGLAESSERGHAAAPMGASTTQTAATAASPQSVAPTTQAPLPAAAIMLSPGTPLAGAIVSAAQQTSGLSDGPADSAAVPIAGLAVEIAARALEGKRRFEIRLDPPELGRIDVRLDFGRDGQVTSRLVVERAETLDLLRRDAAGLERALESAGMRTPDSGLQFSLRDQSGQQRWPGAEQSARPSLLIVPNEDVTVHEAVRRGYGVLRGLGSGLDIQV